MVEGHGAVAGFTPRAATMPTMTRRPNPAPGELDTADAADAASRRRARRWWWAGGIVVVILVGWLMWLGRQSPSDVPRAPRAFCRAAERYENELDRQAAAYKRDIDRQIRYVEDLVATAPRRIRPDTERFLAALREVQGAATERERERLLDDPRVKRAVDSVNRYWNQGCGVFDREGGGF